MNFPNDQQRLCIVGATGSGKTMAAMWHFSRRDYLTRPWVVYDFKHESMITEIPGAILLAVEDAIPSHPGIYVVHPLPDQSDEVEAQMWSIWQRGGIGVYVDEGYMIGNKNAAFRALLTQGRSKFIPMIVLSQRPVWMDKFVFTESDFFQVFRLQHQKDVANVQEFIPEDISERLPQYYSYYYDVHANKMTVLKPVPDREVILNTFELRMMKLRKVV